MYFSNFPYSITFAKGSVMHVIITKVAITKARFGFKVFFTVRCPGPKKNGEGTDADGVIVDIPDEMLIIIAKAAML